MFVRFPPAFIERALDQPLPAVDLLTELRGSQAQYQASLSITGSLGFFTKDQDQIALMEVFSAAVRAGVTHRLLSSKPLQRPSRATERGGGRYH